MLPLTRSPDHHTQVDLAPAVCGCRKGKGPLLRMQASLAYPASSILFARSLNTHPKDEVLPRPLCTG